MVHGIKSLFAIAACAGEDEPRSSALPYAISFAAAAGAHLTAQWAAIRLVLPSAAGSSTISGLVKAENQRLAQIANDRSVALRADAEAAGVACSAASSHTEYGEVMAEVARLSRVNDLTIVDTSSAALGAARSLAETVLFEGGRPVLVIPPGRETFRCRRVIVAWDGGAMASRAVASALPLLRTSDEVQVLSIAGEKDLSKTVPGRRSRRASCAPRNQGHLERSECERTLCGRRAARPGQHAGCRSGRDGRLQAFAPAPVGAGRRHLFHARRDADACLDEPLKKACLKRTQTSTVCAGAFRCGRSCSTGSA